MKKKSFSIPKAKGFDRVVEILALAIVLTMIIVPIVLYSSLPERIPSHYNIAGEIDSYNSRSSVFILPVICLLVYLPITILQCFPHLYNFPVEVTEENAEDLYSIAIRLIRCMKLLVIFVFALLFAETILCAFNIQHGKFVFWVLYGIDIILFPLILFWGIKKIKRVA